MKDFVQKLLYYWKLSVILMGPRPGIILYNLCPHSNCLTRRLSIKFGTVTDHNQVNNPLTPTVSVQSA